jgi:hypothetical protein
MQEKLVAEEKNLELLQELSATEKYLNRLKSENVNVSSHHYSATHLLQAKL